MVKTGRLQPTRIARKISLHAIAAAALHMAQCKADGENGADCIFKKLTITCSAVALSRVLRTALVPYGNMLTSTSHSSETSQVIRMKLCTFDYVRETTHVPSLVGIRPLGVAPHISEIYTSCVFSSFLPAFLLYSLFSCASAQAKRIEIISRTMAQKMQFGVRKCPPSKCFSLIWRFDFFQYLTTINLKPFNGFLSQKSHVQTILHFK